MPAENVWNTVDGQSLQQGPLGEDKPSSNRDRHSLRENGDGLIIS